jgi:hypothetical protein
MDAHTHTHTQTDMRGVAFRFIGFFSVANIKLFASNRNIYVQTKSHLLFQYFLPFLTLIKIWGKNYRVHKVCSGKAIAVWL